MTWLFKYVLARYAGGPGRAAVYLALAGAVTGRLRRRESLLTQRLKPGEQYVIEHLEISHKKQIKQIKREERAAQKARRAARKAPRQPAS
jgi:hypothetical protein